YRHVRIDNIGGIEPPPQADLDYREIDAFAGEVQERHDSDKFKERQVDSAYRGSRAYLVHEGYDFGFADFRRPDPDAFGEADQMRRRVQPNSVACRGDHRVQHGRHRSLAVGTSDMHGLEFRVRVSQAL